MAERMAGGRLEGAPEQLGLPLSWSDHASLESFVTRRNERAAGLLEQLLSGDLDQLLIHGAASAGKSHLLQGACRQLAAQGRQIRYLPLGPMRDYDPRALEDLVDGMGAGDLFVIDDLDQAVGHAAWEASLFAIFNAAKDRSVARLIGARLPLEGLALALSDLRSRLAQGASVRLLAPCDETVDEILSIRASSVGLSLDKEVRSFLLRRVTRDLPSLLSVLARLDRASLSQQRRLTLPFVKRVLGL